MKSLYTDLQQSNSEQKSLVNFNASKRKSSLFIVIVNQCCIPSICLTLSFTRTTLCTSFISSFPMTCSWMIILNQSLSLLLRNVYCMVPDNSTLKNLLINLSFVRALNDIAICVIVAVLHIVGCPLLGVLDDGVNFLMKWYSHIGDACWTHPLPFLLVIGSRFQNHFLFQCHEMFFGLIDEKIST